MRAFRNIGVQEEPGAVEGIADQLPPGCRLYSHSERIEFLCRECIRGQAHREHRVEKNPYRRRVFGKLLVPDAVELSICASALERALRATSSASVACPALWDALGDELGARRARKVWAKIDALPD